MAYSQWIERQQRLGISNKRHWYAVRRSVAETEKLRLAKLERDAHRAPGLGETPARVG
jgi:hypothetical protein